LRFFIFAFPRSRNRADHHPKHVEHPIDRIDPKRRLASLQFGHESKSHAGQLGELDLSQPARTKRTRRGKRVNHG
jgi:hypothetical protein